MNDAACASFLRRLGAFVVDVVVVTLLAAAILLAESAVAVGILPDTPPHLIAIVDAADRVDPGILPMVMLAYLVASWTPLLGRRSIGARAAGIETVRATR